MIRQRAQKGDSQKSFGRSKGGFTTKTRLITNAYGLPIKAEISLGQCSDYTGYDLLQDEDLPDPKVFIADRAMMRMQSERMLRAKGAIAIIPGRSNRKKQLFLDPFVYALRNQIERCFNKLKNARRLATRYDKTANSYLGFIHIVSERLSIKQFANRT